MTTTVTATPSFQSTLVAPNQLRSAVVAAQGVAGISAYAVAIKNGFVGTEEEWLQSLSYASAAAQAATEGARDEAVLAAAAAGNSETAAELAATAAGNSETAAELAATAAGSAQTAAGLSATAAGNSETAAELAATAAGNSETAAELAATAAGNAQTAAELAATAAGNSETAAELAATAAGNAQTAAGNAQTAAELAATAAGNSETAADLSATIAGNSETAAELAATAAGSAQTAAELAATAAGSAQTAADLSATAASLSETAAEAANILAQAWAITPEDTPVIEAGSDFSSLHWAAKSAESQGIAGVFATSAVDAANAAIAAQNNAVAIVTGGTASLTSAAGKIPIADATGKIDPTWLDPLPAISAPLHRSPNAIAAMFVYDTSKDSDGGAWIEKCQHTSWYNEPLCGKWLGTFQDEISARLSYSTLGPEIVVNGTFNSSTTGWTANGNTLALVNNKLQTTSTNWSYQAITVTVGKTYVVSFDFTIVTGSPYFRVGTSAGNAAIIDVNTSGLSRTFSFVAAQTTYYISVGGGSGAVSLLDNVSVKEQLSSGVTSGDYFQSAVDGKFYKLWKNVMPNTSQLQLNWTVANGGTLVGNTDTAPDGTLTATKFVESTSNIIQQFRYFGVSTLPLTGPSTYSLYIKAAGRRYLVLYDSYTGLRCYFDAVTGVVREPQGTFTVTDAGNGWWRLSGTVALSPTGAYTHFRLTVNRTDTFSSGGADTYAGDGTSGILIWGFQVEAGPTLTTYEPKGSDGFSTEVFRGNKAKFPRVAGIVVENSTNAVAIYDLNEPGRPMWASLASSTNTGVSFSWKQICRSIVKSSVAAVNGLVLIGGTGTTPTNGGGILTFDFAKDQLYLRSSSYAGHIGYGPSTISARYDGATANSNVYAPAQFNALANTTNSVVRGISTIVLPDAPTDPTTGLKVPTIAYASGYGVGVIKHDGSSLIGGAGADYSKVAFIKDTLYALLNGGNNLYRTTSPLSTLGASFSMSVQGGVGSPDIWQAGSTMASDLSGRLAKSNTTFSSVSLFKSNISNLAKGAVAHIASTYATGYTTEETRRCYLVDTRVGSLTVPTNLIANGDFSSGINGWSSAAAIDYDSVNQRLHLVPSAANQPAFYTLSVPTVIGNSYQVKLKIKHTYGVNSSCEVRMGGAYAAGTVVPNIETSLTLIMPAVSSVSTIDIRFAGTQFNYEWWLDDVAVKEVVADRSYKAQGALINGTLTKALTSPAANNQLVAYSGFSATNYLQEPYSADLAFGTGEFSVGAYVNIPVTLSAGSFPTIGSELQVDGGFTAGNLSNWTYAAGSTGFSVVDGELFGNATGTQIGLASTTGITLTAGKCYRISCTARRVSGSRVRLFVGGDNNSGYGYGIFEFTSTTNTTQHLYVIGTGGLLFAKPYVELGASGYYDNISVTEVGYAYAIDRSSSSGSSLKLGIAGNGRLIAILNDGTTTRTATTNAYNTGTFIKAVANYRAGRLAIEVNGVEVAVTNGAPLLTLNNSNAVLTIGNSYALDAPFPGSITLVRIGATVPTPEQSLWMYEQEKMMFRDGAQITLPAATAVTDLTYDEASDKWVVVQATHKSSWTGLVRTAVETPMAGSFAKAEVKSGIELTARATTVPGVNVVMPAMGLREELVRRAEAAAAQSRTLQVFDFDTIGFTATTVSGSNILTSVASIVGTPYIGMGITGTGIPAATTLTGINGTTYYMSANATANGSTIAIGQSTFTLASGWTATEVIAASASKREGSTKDWVRLYDGFRETIRFATSPGSAAWVQVTARKDN